MSIENELDKLLERHLAAELDGLRGRARAHFERVIGSGEPRRLSTWLLLGPIGAIAASVALMAFVRPVKLQDSEITPVTREINSGPLELERSVAWRTFDEGTVLLEDNTPMRRVRREVLERVQYYDPQRQKLVEVTIPDEEVFLIGMNMY